MEILRSAVEHEFLFRTEDEYEEYLASLIEQDEPFELVDEQECENGTYIVVLRVGYGDAPLFRTEEEVISCREKGESAEAEATMVVKELSPEEQEVFQEILKQREAYWKERETL